MRLWTFPIEKFCCFSNLKSIRIAECKNLLHLFPTSIAESLSQLERLKVSGCPAMKEIFKREEREGEITTATVKFPKLFELCLDNLPSLRGFIERFDRIEVPALSELTLYDLPSSIEDNNDIQQHQFCFHREAASNSIQFHVISALSNINLNFRSLQSLKIKSINNFKSLFSPSLLSSFPNLERLYVISCSKLEYVVGEEEIDHVAVGETEAKTTLFCQLRVLILEDLPQLLTFCHGMGDPEHDSQPLFSKEVAGKSVQLHFTPALSNINFNFSGLGWLNIKSINNVKSLFSPSLLSCFPNLGHLCIESCSKLEQVVGEEQIDHAAVGGTKAKTILFPQLWYLWLKDLPQLLVFCSGTGDLELPSLGEVHIDNCPKMETFVKQVPDVPVPRIGSATSDPQHVVSQPLFTEQVLCQKLETLGLLNLNVVGIFSQSIPIESWCGLQTLRIECCHKITNLFSASIARGLTSIKDLDLEDSEELEEVIAKEDQQEQTDVEETLFPHLKELKLRRLRKMQRFCHMKNSLELPSLEEVTIEGCPALETFSLGSLRLRSFKRLFGLSDPDFAVRFFFNKEISPSETHLDNNCFTISSRDLSIDFGHYVRLRWGLSPDHSSCSFFTVAEFSYFRSLKIGGKIEIANLLPGVAYEIILIILVEGVERWDESVVSELTLLGRVPHHQRKIQHIKPSGEWVELLLGEITREHDQAEPLEFSFSFTRRNCVLYRLMIKGVMMRLKV